MPTHFRRTKLAATDQCKVKTSDGTVTTTKIVEVLERGTIKVAAPADKRGKKDTIEVRHASEATKGETIWYAFNPAEKLVSADAGIVTLEFNETL